MKLLLAESSGPVDASESKPATLALIKTRTYGDTSRTTVRLAGAPGVVTALGAVLKAEIEVAAIVHLSASEIFIDVQAHAKIGACIVTVFTDSFREEKT